MLSGKQSMSNSIVWTAVVIGVPPIMLSAGAEANVKGTMEVMQ
jgi:hypothetical protein